MALRNTAVQYLFWQQLFFILISLITIQLKIVYTGLFKYYNDCSCIQYRLPTQNRDKCEHYILFVDNISGTVCNFYIELFGVFVICILNK